jgi:hypothetical protein
MFENIKILKHLMFLRLKFCINDGVNHNEIK